MAKQFPAQSNVKLRVDRTNRDSNLIGNFFCVSTVLCVASREGLRKGRGGVGLLRHQPALMPPVKCLLHLSLSFPFLSPVPRTESAQAHRRQMQALMSETGSGTRAPPRPARTSASPSLSMADGAMLWALSFPIITSPRHRWKCQPASQVPVPAIAFVHGSLLPSRVRCQHSPCVL